jgi:hypothetical protein
MPGFDEPLWDQIAKALADINAQQAPVMPGSDESPPDPIAKVIADLAQQVASLWMRLEALESQQSVTTAAAATPPGFPYGLPGYWTAVAVSMPDSTADLSQLPSLASC